MNPPAPDRINPLAQALNDQLEQAAPALFGMLSAYGRRLYFPKGILSQSAEAKEKAHRVNATIGIATEGQGPMFLPSIQRELPGLDPSDVYPYAPGAGRPQLRQLWREKLLAENPSLGDKEFGQPIVTSAITHGLSLVGDLFFDPGDTLLLPDKLWGNYRLGYEVRYGARIETYPFYADGGFNTAGFAETLARTAQDREKLIVLLNFPNNPTGYMPTPAEGAEIVDALVAQAEQGTQLVVLIDDAYFGLFFHLGAASMTESLFGLLANRHPNLLAVKLDGTTKELFVWGLRCGFVTFGPGDAATAETACAVLDAKTRGAIRASISNVSHLSQSLVEKAMASEEIAAERAEKHAILGARAQKCFEIANQPQFAKSWDVYPFNSGYFMCVRVRGVDAEQLRLQLLDQYGVGLIATSAEDIRIAFSCMELAQVEPLFETLHEAIQGLQ